MKEFDYSKVKHYKTYDFIKAVFRPLVKLVYKTEFKGLENIPSDRTDYIVAINHTCALDPVFVACPKKVPALHFMAKAELFKNPVSAWLITHMYGFPVKRGKGDTSAIDYGINSVLLECVATEGRNNDLIDLLNRKFDQVEIVRGGIVAIESISMTDR